MGSKLFIAAGVIVLILVMLGQRSPEQRSADLVEKKRECAKAMTSSIGHSTSSYADHQAYEKEVREKCEGLEINGKPITAP
jgi:hypothetical protein